MALPISYNVRSLRVRWQVTLLAIAGIAMIVQKGSMSEMTSGIPRAHVDMISVDSRVARDAKGQPLASPEIMLVANLRRVADNAETDVALRGVSLKALEVRGPITVTKGRIFTPGLYELMVGER